MPQREGADDGGLQYRSPITQAAPPPPYTVDEANFDTLKSVLADLDREMATLNKDFNAFEIGKDDLPADRAKKLLHEVEVRQAAFDILMPIRERLFSGINIANENFKQRNQTQ